MFSEFKNDKSNFVRLTARQHFIAHWILWKAYSTLEMARAFHLMHLNKRSSRSYSAVRHIISENMKGNRNFGSCIGPENGFYGKHHTEENRKKTSDRVKGEYASGKKICNFTGIHNFGEDNPFFGKNHTEETIEKLKVAASNRPHDYYNKIANTLKLRPKLICPYCLNEMDERNAKRWHFDNCKLKNT